MLDSRVGEVLHTYRNLRVPKVAADRYVIAEVESGAEALLAGVKYRNDIVRADAGLRKPLRSARRIESQCRRRTDLGRPSGGLYATVGVPAANRRLRVDAKPSKLEV